MKLPSPQEQNSLTNSLLLSLKDNHDRAGTTIGLPSGYEEWAQEVCTNLLKEYKQVEDAASTDLNRIYKEDMVDKNNMDKESPEIIAKLASSFFPAITKAMLNQEPYEDLIWDELQNHIN